MIPQNIKRALSRTPAPPAMTPEAAQARLHTAMVRERGAESRLQELKIAIANEGRLPDDDAALPRLRQELKESRSEVRRAQKDLRTAIRAAGGPSVARRENPFAAAAAEREDSFSARPQPSGSRPRLPDTRPRPQAHERAGAPAAGPRATKAAGLERAPERTSLALALPRFFASDRLEGRIRALAAADAGALAHAGSAASEAAALLFREPDLKTALQPHVVTRSAYEKAQAHLEVATNTARSRAEKTALTEAFGGPPAAAQSAYLERVGQLRTLLSAAELYR